MPVGAPPVGAKGKRRPLEGIEGTQRSRVPRAGRQRRGPNLAAEKQSGWPPIERGQRGYRARRHRRALKPGRNSNLNYLNKFGLFNLNNALLNTPTDVFFSHMSRPQHP